MLSHAEEEQRGNGCCEHSALRWCPCQPLQPCSASSTCCKASGGLVGVEFRAGASARESFLPTLLCMSCFRSAWSRHPVPVCTTLLMERGDECHGELTCWNCLHSHSDLQRCIEIVHGSFSFLSVHRCGWRRWLCSFPARFQGGCSGRSHEYVTAFDFL